MLAEVPMDAAFAAGFGGLLHRQLQLRMPASVLVGMLSLSAACAASLGLALGAVARTEDNGTLELAAELSTSAGPTARAAGPAKRSTRSARRACAIDAIS